MLPLYCHVILVLFFSSSNVQGYVHIMTRTDDVINVAGHRLSTGAMEEVIPSYALKSYQINNHHFLHHSTLLPFAFL